MRKKIVAGNWKMNKDLKESQLLIEALKAQSLAAEVSVMIAPTFVNLTTALESVKGSAIEVIAQNMHYADNGAFTGEISAEMLKSVGIKTVILGHSERRSYFGETDEILEKKVFQAINNGLQIMFCFGEELEDRKAGTHFHLVASQLQNALFSLPKEAWAHIILAYEPVWAIGTGETASAEQVQEMHAFIRKTIADAYYSELADAVSILYGGSVKPGNAVEIFSKPDVDGGLIGGAALVASDFAAIVNAFN
ncbi:MAG: triose-phosphate isomerase [Flavobacteriaceae bacterium]|tara:strand:+ start:50 stop:802 length:753 start_codon:yes stop_codon:yes gene_type:complete